MVRSGGGEGIQTCSLVKGNFLQVISEHHPERRRVLWSSVQAQTQGFKAWFWLCGHGRNRIFENLHFLLWSWQLPSPAPPTPQGICWGLNEKNLCQGPRAVYGTLKTLYGFQLFKKSFFSKCAGVELICLFFCFKYMSTVNLATFNIISHY